MPGQDRAHVVASGFVALLASQISTRLVTFLINLLTARHLTPEAYGLSAVQFHLITTTALFISREGFRRGCLRFGGSMGSGSGAENKDDAGPAPTRGTETTGKAGQDGAVTKADGAAGGEGGGVDNMSVLRVAWLVVPLGLLVTAAVCGVAVRQQPATGADGSAVPYYREAVVLHGIAAVLELLAEPFYILASVHLMFKARVAVEFTSTLAKSLITLALVQLGSSSSSSNGSAGGAAPGQQQLLAKALGALFGVRGGGSSGLPPALVFSVAQLSLSLVVLLGYGAVGLRLLRRGRRQQATAGTAADGRAGRGSGARGAHLSPTERDVLWTSALFTLQAVEKLALAEGSKVVLATMQSAVNQGVYGLVSNLGSLVVRTLFQPLEEAAFAAFSAWGAEAKASTPAEPASEKSGRSSTKASGSSSSSSRGEAGMKLQPLLRALSPMVKAVALLGLLAAAFGPSYSYVLLRLVYGTRWSETEAPAVLAAYSVYVLLLALNGIGEAFVHAVLDARGLSASNGLLLAFAGAHLAACVGLVGRHGALGLVAADGINMVLRIAYSAWCIKHFFRPLHGFSLLRDLLPSPATLAACMGAAAVTAASNRLIMGRLGPSAPTGAFLKAAALHVAVGACVLAVLLGLVVLRTERGTLRQVLAMRRQRKGGVAGAEDDVGPGVAATEGAAGGKRKEE